MHTSTTMAAHAATLAASAVAADNPLAAMQFSQASLNVANAARVTGEMPEAPDIKLEVSLDQMRHMTERFLQWALPANFAPDGGISFTPHGSVKANWPVGTNLFTAGQAQEMVRFMMAGLPPA